MTRFVLAVLLALASVPALAPAARAGELDLTGSLSGFTSPNGAFGPWRTLTFTDRMKAGADQPGLTLVDRADADAAGPTHSLGIVLDDYHDWSPRFFTYAAIGLASGTVLPTRSAYLEGDVKLGRALTTVLGAGAGVVANPDGTSQRYLNIGPSWYHNNMNVTLRWLPSFTSGRGGSSSGLLTWANGAAGTTVTTLTLLGGSAPPSGIVSAATTGIGQRALYAGVDVKRWVTPRAGYHVGLELEQLTDRTTGNLIYVRRGLNLGVFQQIGS